MIRNPQEIHWWISYHKSMGVSAFFIRLEDSPHWEQYLRENNDVWYMESGSSDPYGNNYVTQADRQGVFVNRIIDWCVNHRDDAKRIDFLFHIDQDELLHGSFDFLSKLHKDTKVLHLKNTEAQYDTDDRFTDATCFRAKGFVKCWEPGSSCRAYANGKSGCKIDPEVRYHGPHNMIYKNMTSTHPFYYDIPFEELHVRHFDSCTIGVFASKFHHMSKGLDTKPIPFPKYLSSLEKIKNLYLSYRDNVSYNRQEMINNSSLMPSDH